MKEKSKWITLYKGTLMDEGLGDEESQIELARLPLTLNVTNDTIFGLKALLDLGASHNFISHEVWESLLQVTLNQPNVNKFT